MATQKGLAHGMFHTREESGNKEMSFSKTNCYFLELLSVIEQLVNPPPYPPTNQWSFLHLSLAFQGVSVVQSMVTHWLSVIRGHGFNPGEGENYSSSYLSFDLMIAIFCKYNLQGIVFILISLCFNALHSSMVSKAHG